MSVREQIAILIVLPLLLAGCIYPFGLEYCCVRPRWLMTEEWAAELCTERGHAAGTEIYDKCVNELLHGPEGEPESEGSDSDL